MCDNIIVKHLSESVKCSFSCGTSFNDGECGGIGYFSMYEIMNITLPDTHFGGFCLTYRQQSESNKTMLYSLACNEEANGYCVMVNGLNVWSPICQHSIHTGNTVETITCISLGALIGYVI